jgi:hypothetical protein
MTGQRREWWIKSFADGDTHTGAWSAVTRSVHTRCGLEFQPIPVGLPARLGPLPGSPPDPDQVCPRCVHSP